MSSEVTNKPLNTTTITPEALTAKVNAIKMANEQKAKAKEAEENGTTEDEDALSAAEKSHMQKIVRRGLIASKHDVEVMRKDPSSPLYSIKSFEDLHLKPDLLKGVYNMGYNAPSKIQETTIPTLLADPPQNMIAQSQSGTGKTASFVLAMLSRVNPSLNYPQALCLSPTYELAVQTGEIVAKMGAYCTDIKIRYVVRGEEVNRGSKVTEHILIGTPGKVVDWMIKLKLFDPTKIIVFVLDEADIMIDTQGHQEQSHRIRRQLSPNCQIMFFSATYDNDVMNFAEIMVPNAVVIKLKREEESLENIKQYYVKCGSSEEKYSAIENIYGSITVGQAMIFCQTKKKAVWLAGQLTSKQGQSVAVLTGDLAVDQRLAVLDRFRDGKHKVLITTNVLSRGIDIESVTLVVNFDLPVDVHGNADCETYLHRIGRTGRFGKSGAAVNLIDSEESMRILNTIKQHFSVEIDLLNTDDLDEIQEKLEGNS